MFDGLIQRKGKYATQVRNPGCAPVPASSLVPLVFLQCPTHLTLLPITINDFCRFASTEELTVEWCGCLSIYSSITKKLLDRLPCIFTYLKIQTFLTYEVKT